jgi:hypothetical protein
MLVYTMESKLKRAKHTIVYKWIQKIFKNTILGRRVFPEYDDYDLPSVTKKPLSVD